MFALGQKRTCAVQKGMSALPPKATAKADTVCVTPAAPQEELTWPRALRRYCPATSTVAAGRHP